MADASRGESTIASKEDLADFIDALKANFIANPSEWENSTVGQYLDAMSAWVRAMDSYYQNSGKAPVKSPSWALFADILAAAKIYE